MIIPCIDLQDGKAVQLIHGRKRALAVDDVLGLLDRFSSYPILHIIDLDAAMRKGSNARWIKLLCARAKIKVRVGVAAFAPVARAARILSWGAEKIIIGSAAFKNGKVNQKFLGELKSRAGKNRIIIALDTERGYIVVRGWRERLKLRPADVIPELEKYCSGFLSTLVDNEGAMKGTDLKWFRELQRATKLYRKSSAARRGITTMREVEILSNVPE